METIYAKPLTGIKLAQVRIFLADLGLDWDNRVQATFLIYEDGVLVATGSRQKNVLKCIGVANNSQGEGYAATLVSLLSREGLEAGYRHLFLYTKPENIPFFLGLGFYEVAVAQGAALLENRRCGVRGFIESVRKPAIEYPVGCVVANCNPFTNGHLYLMEQAATSCGSLYIFILSEENSRFDAATRLRLVQEGLSHLQNATISATGGYLVSTASFPDYFIRDKSLVRNISCALDIEIFTRHFVKQLGISRRFVGTEPYSAVTGAYNEQMKAVLPFSGVEVVELSRLEYDGAAVSASRVRALLDEGRLSEARPLVPESTWRFLEKGGFDGSV